MTGHVTRHRSAWVWRIEVGRDEEGKRVRRRSPRTFKTKKEAQQDLTRALHEMDSGTWVEPSKQTVAEYLSGEWLPAIRATVAASTFHSYERNIALHVCPAVGSIPLSKLQPSHLNALYASLAEGERPLAAKTIRYIHTTIHRALRDAQRWGKLPRNPAALADPPKVKASEAMTVWTSEQVQTFLEGVSGERLHSVYLLALTTGARRGELLGLRWSDVDLEKGTVSIRRSLVSIGYRVEFSEPKTPRSRRTITIDPATVSALKAYRKRQLEDKLACGPGWIDSDLVFVREDGSPWHPQLVSDAFDKAVKRSGLPRLRFHDLRHCHATLSLESGMRPWDLSDRLGHASVAFTLQTYRHAVQATQDSAALAAAEFILGTNK